MTGVPTRDAIANELQKMLAPVNQFGGFKKWRTTRPPGGPPYNSLARETRLAVVVHKYGGSSVGDLSRIGRVADRIASAVAAGDRPVVVVSAMGNTTNELLALAKAMSPVPDRRELDMLVSVGERVTMALLAMGLRDRGVPARSLTGSQSGILTDGTHAGARVVAVRPDRVRDALAAGETPIVAGFQGVSVDKEITTLGRGGSDTTAVVLAAALGAERCEICSDVDGVWSADPRRVPDAVRLDAIGLDAMASLARAGATVLFEDAVRYARDHGVTLHAARTFGGGRGTTIGPEPQPGVWAVASDRLLRSTKGAPRGARLRRRWGEHRHWDVRNLHGAPLDGVEVAVVSAVASGLGEWNDGFDLASEALAGAGLQLRHCGADGDSWWFEVDPSAEDAAVRALHAHLADHDPNGSAVGGRTG